MCYDCKGSATVCAVTGKGSVTVNAMHACHDWQRVCNVKCTIILLRTYIHTCIYIHTMSMVTLPPGLGLVLSLSLAVKGTIDEVFLCLTELEGSERSCCVGEGVMGGGEGVALERESNEGARIS